MSQTESEIKREICEFLELRNAFPTILGQKAKSKYRSKYLRDGIPDLMAIWKKQIIFIEVKKPKGVISEEQADFMHRMMESGVNCYVVFSLEELIFLLEPN